MVGPSLVGPVIVPMCALNGATMTVSRCRSASLRRSAAQAHEVHRARHALAVVDEQHEIGGQRLARDQVDLLRHAVLAHREGGRLEVGDETAALVVHAGFEQDARDLSLFRDFKRRETDGVADQPAGRIAGLDDNLALLERILVHPVDGRVATGIGRANQLAVHVEADRRKHLSGRDVDLGDDAHPRDDAGAPERRRDPDRRDRRDRRCLGNDAHANREGDADKQTARTRASATGAQRHVGQQARAVGPSKRWICRSAPRHVLRSRVRYPPSRRRPAGRVGHRPGSHR